jgi:riboflavin kinase/FMN adenylyltransferase
MQQYDALDQLFLPSSCVTIGVFDGLHLGHHKVIRSTVALARSQKLPAVLLTFHPHPAVVLGKMDQPRYLLDSQDKFRLIQAMGVDHLVTLQFTQAMANMDAAQFVDLLMKQLHMQNLITGEDFSLGRNREGNQATLKQLGERYHFELIQVPEVDNQGKRISSTQIRDHLRKGEVYQANKLLGRAYHFSGNVVDGEHRGRNIGFPTANLIPDADRLVPRFGVYATLLEWQSHLYPAITNIGSRPTFNSDSQQITIETYILDFSETLYGQSIYLHLVDFIRPEIKFPSSDLLKQQIQTDIQTAREVLSHAKDKTNLFTGSADPLP